MGLLARSASYVRYAVEGELPANFWQEAAARVSQKSFRDIDESFEESSAGWVSVLNMFDNEFAYASYAVGEHLVLSLRIDERRVSAKILKKFCLKEEERIKKERQVPKLARSHRVEIKENIKLMLMKRAIPVPEVYDLCWNLAESTLLFFSTSQKAQELLEEFFKETFDLNLILQVPYLTAEHLLDDEGRQSLANISPTIFI